MKFRKAIQLVILIFGVYGANINSMDPFYDPDLNGHADYNGPESLQLEMEMLSTFQQIPNQQQMQQQLINQQQQMQQLLLAQQQHMLQLPNQQQMMQQLLLTQQLVLNQQQISGQLSFVQQQVSSQQQVQQQLPSLQELLSAEPQISSQQQNVQMTAIEQIEKRVTALMRGSSVVEKPKPSVVEKPRPLVAREAIALDRNGPVMGFIAPRQRGKYCFGCREAIRALPNKLVVPQSDFINSADEFLTHEYVAANDQYLPYPKPSKTFLNSDTISVAEKIRRYKLSFDQVREANLAIAHQQLLNIEPRAMYVELLNAIEVIDELDIKYKNPDTLPNVAFIFSPTFYVLNEKRLNIPLPSDKHGLYPYPQPENSFVCINHYQQRFKEVYKHNRVVIKDKNTPEVVKDYDAMMEAISEMAVYSLLSGKQARLIKNKFIKKLCEF